jgi:uncharacterized protein (DUF1697 family)
MITYVAFLRGINVGGNNVIKMDALRAEFETMGFLDVKTYIQSGNVIFQSEMTDKDKIRIKIEKALSVRFRYAASVMVRSKKDIEHTISHFPTVFEDSNWKHNVIFLGIPIDSKSILKRFEIKKDLEQISYAREVLFWSARLDGITRSTMLKLSTRREYQYMTARNINTTKKILEIMKDSKI